MGQAPIRLRGHHLLCLLGYRGMGYSAEYVANMTRVHQRLKSAPDTPVLLVTGPDDLCEHFPDSQPYHCQNENIHRRDAEVLARLGLAVGAEVAWREVERRIQASVEAADIDVLCSTCSWRGYGVCAEGVDDIRAGRGLRCVPKPQETGDG